MSERSGPRRLQTRCRVPDCRQRTRDGYCSEHQQQRYQRAADRYRGTPAERGYDQDWRRLRTAYYRQHPFCEDCLEQGVHTSEHIEVDHVIPIAVRPDLRLQWSNLRSRCRSHHQAKTHRDRQTYGQRQTAPSCATSQHGAGGRLETTPLPSIPPATACTRAREIGHRGCSGEGDANARP